MQIECVYSFPFSPGFCYLRKTDSPHPVEKRDLHFLQALKRLPGSLVATVTRDGRIARAEGGLFDYFGLEASLFEGTMLVQSLPEAFLPGLVPLLERLFEGREDDATLIQTPVYTYEVLGRPTRWHQGLVAEVVVLVREITRTLTHSRQVTGQYEGLLQALDSLPEPLCEIDEHFQVLVWNKAAATLTTLPASVLLGNNLVEFFPQVLDTWLVDLLMQVFQSRQSRSFELIYTNPEGKTYTLDISASRSVRGVVLLARDVGTRRQAETELTRLKNRIASVIEAISDTVFAVDADYRLLAFNQVYAQQLQQRFQYVPQVGASMFLPGTPLETIATWQERIDATLRHGEKRLVEEIKEPDGRLVYLNIALKSILDESGKPLGATILIKNITPFKRAEAEKLDLIEELSRRNQELQQYAYITSHNLRGPVANMMSAMEHTERAELSAENMQMFQIVNDSIQRLNQTLVDLTEVFALRQRAIAEPTPVHLGELVERLTRELSDQHQIPFVLDQEYGSEPALHFPPAHLESILRALLENALLYHKPSEPAYLSVMGHREGRFYHLQLADRGLGIDLERHGKRLFGLYQQFHNESRGRGLGLMLTKARVEALGGKLSLESAPGQGTTVHLRLVEEK